MTTLDLNVLDQGIQQTVAWLREQGFETTDSGDGATKSELIEDGEALDVPHVFMRVDDPLMLIAESQRLAALVCAKGLGEECSIEASYSPLDGVSILALMGVDDCALGGVERGIRKLGGGE